MRPSIHTKRLISSRARLLAAAAVVSVALALTGCGGSSSPGVAHISSGKGAPSASSTGSSSSESKASSEQAGLAYSKCMRANGVPSFPDPSSGGGLVFHASRGLTSSPAFKAAQAKCQKLLPAGPAPPGSQTHPSPQTLARFLRIARCMRKHGVSDFPDPRTSAPPLGHGIGEISNIEEVIFVFPSTINRQSPVFTQAAAACAFPLHNH